MARKRRKFTREYKAEAVRLAREGAKVGKSAGMMAKELDLTETALRSWIRQADIDEGRGPEDALTSDEKSELSSLRKEVRVLRMERELLKNRRGRRPTCWARSSGRATTTAARKERPAAFWRPVPVKKHGPGSAADLRLVTPSGDPV
jgi:transposase